jgi:hypothetical protein
MHLDLGARICMEAMEVSSMSRAKNRYLTGVLYAGEWHFRTERAAGG